MACHVLMNATRLNKRPIPTNQETLSQWLFNVRSAPYIKPTLVQCLALTREDRRGKPPYRAWVYYVTMITIYVGCQRYELTAIVLWI